MCFPLVLLVLVAGPALVLAGVLVDLGGHGPAGVAAGAGLLWVLARTVRGCCRSVRTWWARATSRGL